MKCTRRQFLKTAGTASLGLYASTLLGCGRTGGGSLKPRTVRAGDISDKLVVAMGEEIDPLVRAAMKALGGMEKLVQSGDTVVIKPNIGWSAEPEYAACSNPETVSALVKLCIAADAGSVKVFDNPCDDKRRTYSESGIKSAAESAGAEVLFIDESSFGNLEIPQGKALTEWPAIRAALECDVLINVPIPKQHGSTGLTLALKNLMGLAGGDRGKWHQDIHTKITDFYTAVPCDLTVIDAYRIVTRNGPRTSSLSDVEVKKTIAICKDAVAADAFAAQELFGRKAEQIGYIRQAHERGLGDMDYESRVFRV